LISLYYSNISIFGGFLADNIGQQIQLSEFYFGGFSVDKNSAANSSIGGGLGICSYIHHY